MKHLYIVRHGKSSWDYSNVSDEDRPLAQRGINDAYKMADRLKASGARIDLIISSTANRALYTAVIFSKVLNLPTSALMLEPALYMSYEEEIISVIKGAPNDTDSLMIFGHNPSFTQLANMFTSSYIDNIPTAGIVKLELDIDNWADINKRKVVKDFFDYPKKQ